MFWTATIISASIWLFGDGLYHFTNAFWDHNLAPGNIGTTFYLDFLIPPILMLLLALYHQTHDIPTDVREISP